MKRFGFLLAGAGLVALVMSGEANAVPTCSSTTSFPTGSGNVSDAFLAGGGCVLTQDKLWSGFNLGNLPAGGSVFFSLNTIGHMDFHQIAFDNSFTSGTTYTFSYAVQVSGGVPGTTITRLDGDFAQTASTAASVLTKTSLPPGTPPGGITLDKTGIFATCVSGDTTFGGCAVDYSPGVTSLLVAESLVDNGTISSITDTVVENIPVTTPEPGTLFLLGTGLAGLAGVARRRRRQS